MVARVSYIVSLPERAARAIAAILGGGLHESFELALPRMVRQSRLYEATARNLLRVTIELVGGVEPLKPTVNEYEPNPGRLAVRKGAGNVLELGSILAFGFSPLWVLAAAADVTHGSRAYLDTLVGELVNEGVLRVGTEFKSVDELLAALEGVSGTTARLIDIPPLEAIALRRSLEDMRSDASSMPTADELARVYQAIRAAAAREGSSMIDVSLGVGFAFFNSARHVGRQHLLDPYKEDLKPLRDEGFAAYARRVSRPYADAVARHFDGELPVAHRERHRPASRRPQAARARIESSRCRAPARQGRAIRSVGPSGSSPGWRRARTARSGSARSRRVSR